MHWENLWGKSNASRGMVYGSLEWEGINWGRGMNDYGKDNSMTEGGRDGWLTGECPHCLVAVCFPYRAALDRAAVLLKMGMGGLRIDNLWGTGGGQRPVTQLVREVRPAHFIEDWMSCLSSVCPLCSVLYVCQLFKSCLCSPNEVIGM